MSKGVRCVCGEEKNVFPLKTREIKGVGTRYDMLCGKCEKTFPSFEFYDTINGKLQKHLVFPLIRKIFKVRLQEVAND